ncbi:MAG: helicase [Firmicutes bacterium]|nr:helicase [Bacillota bacterium]
MIKKIVWQREERRLQIVCDEIEEQLKVKREDNDAYKENIVEIRRSMWDEAPHTAIDFDGVNFEDVNTIQQHLENLRQEENKHLFFHKQIKILEKLLDKPYFARVDFQETGEEVEKIYIGLSTLFDDDTKDILIYDWRSPICSIFYDYELGPAKYNAVNDDVYGDIKLKRQFGISNRKIHYMFDSSIKIDDEILQRVLSQSSNDKMKNIIMTIQKEQNKIIRDDKNNLLIVQGAAGSGKTSIALHRIAYLMYKYRDKNIGSENIIIFSPNEIFNDYISEVLPELGEENSQQTTFYDYAKKSIGSNYKVESMMTQMEYLLNYKEDSEYSDKIKAIRYKTSKKFLNVINKYIRYIEEHLIEFHDIEYNDRILISKEELEDQFYNGFKMWPMAVRLRKIRERIWKILRPIQKTRLKEIEKEMKFKVDFEHEIKPFSRLKRMEEFRPIIHDVEDMTSIDIMDLYKKLFSNEGIFFKIIEEDGLEDYLINIKDITVTSLNNKFIPYEDIAPILLLKAELEGTLNLAHIRHVVIDESQDYTLFQYEIFKRLFKKSNLTVLGDISQSIHPYISPVSHKDIMETFNLKNTALMKLTKSYRSTKEIFDFSKGILTEETNIESIDRRGEKPKLTKVSSYKQMAKYISEDILNLEKQGAKSIAVICKTAKESERVYEMLGNIDDIRLINSEDTKYKSGKVVIPSYLAKGLEFDAVLVYDAGINSYGYEEERGLFYTICTRALHNLHLYCKGEPSSFIQQIDTELYEVYNKHN